jgi:hypothetical protein
VFQFYLQHLSETFPVLRRIQRYIIINAHILRVQYRLLLSDFNEIEFSLQMFENT